MLIVVPFHRGDSSQAAATLDWCADLCGQQENVCILAHEELTPSGDVQRAASRAFRTVEHLQVSACADGWPISANCYFGCIAAAMRGREEWLLLEPDCTITHKQGFVRLEVDYRRAGRPCLGTVIPAYFFKNGAWTQVGDMLAGVAIYHQNLWDHSPLLRALRSTQAAYAKAKATPKAFDCYLAPEILLASGVTPLIQHMGRSREFRREGADIICSYDPGARWNPVVSPEAVLVHGCKDGSLIALLRAEMGIPAGKGSVAPAAAPAIVSTPARKAPKADFQWGDDAALPRESAPATPPPRPADATRPAERRQQDPEQSNPAPVLAIDKEAFATIGDAMRAIRHWPDCKRHELVLQERKGVYRLACQQCQACSPKLPPGPDWEEAWKNHAGKTVETSIKGGDEPCAQTHQDSVSKTSDSSTVSITSSNGTGALGPSSNTSIPSASNGAVASNPPPAPVPINSLRHKRDIIANYPELAKLKPGQFRNRVKQLKKQERAAKAKPVAAALDKKTERLLTTEARARKMQLLDLGKGKQGAFLKIRAVAVDAGVKGTSGLTKDQIIIAILEREFENPYLETEEAVA